MYGQFQRAGRYESWDRGRPDPERPTSPGGVRSCQSKISLHREQLTVLAGEGPIHLEKRLRRMLPGTPVSWDKIVQQNKVYFRGVTSTEDIRNFDYRHNPDLKPGDIITFEYYAIEPVAQEMAPPAAGDLVTIIDPVTQTPLKLAIKGNLKSSSSIEVVFGIQTDVVEAKLGIGLELFSEGEFVLDREGLHGDTARKFKFFVEGEAGIDIGPLEWSASARGTFDPSNGAFEISVDRNLTQDLKNEKFNKAISDKIPKGSRVSAGASGAISYSYFHFEYDSKRDVTQFGVAVTVNEAFEGTVKLGSPFIQLKLSTSGTGTIFFFAEVPGKQSHLKPPSLQPIQNFQD